ncbi:MAG: penicillin-binding transpeptidase domain-containing protein [Verrucomicrobiota bacterium]|jgi:penicillin-binding protein 2
MLIFDELKKNDPQLRLVAMVLVSGLGLLLAGLWWVQVVSAREYENHLETQSYRTVRIPAVRGKILDREGRVLAENHPCYNLCLFLGDLQKPFAAAYGQRLAQARDAQKQAIAVQEKKLGRSLTKTEQKSFALTTDELEKLREQSRFAVADNLVAQIGQHLGQPLTLDAAEFERDYETRLVLPCTILANLNDTQIARFEEQSSGELGADLELQSVRTYPFGATAANLIGYLQRNEDSEEGEDAFFSYRLPDYRGQVGIEAGFDSQLRGRAGEETVLVNNLGYRQSENIWSQPEPGENVVLTIDLDIQRAAEESLVRHQGADARAAIVVMDVRDGDVLAMVSSPAVDPNYFTGGLSQDEFQKTTAELSDPKLRPQINRATQENYAPGSIFKPITGLAALENGLDPNALVDNPGYIYVGQRHIKDLAAPGQYNLRRAIMHSSNSYFITVGLRAGIENIIRLAQKFHLGERTDLPTRQETKGILPSLERVQSDWRDGDTANICIGQGELAVTPLQMAVAYSAIANGGKVLWPCLVEKIEPQDPASDEAPVEFPSGLVRDELGVHPRSLKILHDAMLAETEDPEGTGFPARVPGLRICGKTGTAQVMNERNQVLYDTVWFASFAPYENPRYAVVVMVESGSSGGGTCAPIAHDIYETILKKENAPGAKNLARN